MIFVRAQTQGGLVSVSFPHGPGVTSSDTGRGAHLQVYKREHHSPVMSASYQLTAAGLSFLYPRVSCAPLGGREEVYKMNRSWAVRRDRARQAGRAPADAMSGHRVCFSPEAAGLELAKCGVYAHLPRAGSRGCESPSALSHPLVRIFEAGRWGPRHRETKKTETEREAEPETQGETQSQAERKHAPRALRNTGKNGLGSKRAEPRRAFCSYASDSAPRPRPGIGPRSRAHMGFLRTRLSVCAALAVSVPLLWLQPLCTVRASGGLPHLCGFGQGARGSCSVFEVCLAGRQRAPCQKALLLSRGRLLPRDLDVLGQTVEGPVGKGRWLSLCGAVEDGSSPMSLGGVGRGRGSSPGPLLPYGPWSPTAWCGRDISAPSTARGTD